MNANNSAYELQRDATVAENQAKLRALGLERVVPTPPPRQQRTRRRTAPASEPTRSSKRTVQMAPDYTGETIDAFGDDERRLRLAVTAAPTVPAAAPAAAPKRRKAPRLPSAIVDAVRSYVEEHVPEEHELEERQMFGMAMWLVRGNMFLGVGLKSERLLVRVCCRNPPPPPALTFTSPLHPSLSPNPHHRHRHRRTRWARAV